MVSVPPHDGASGEPADMLAGAMGGMIAARLPGPAFVRGALFAVAPWLMAQLMVKPMTGRPVFSGSATAAMGSQIGHLVYGAAIGTIIGAGVPATGARAVRQTA